MTQAKHLVECERSNPSSSLVLFLSKKHLLRRFNQRQHDSEELGVGCLNYDSNESAVNTTGLTSTLFYLCR